MRIGFIDFAQHTGRLEKDVGLSKYANYFTTGV
jgi:hypothetical protein